MSTAHVLHGDIHTFGLADACERCREHAENPLHGLDNETLTNLMHRIAMGDRGRSENEQIAIANLRRVLDDACCLARANPLAFKTYANSKWNLSL